MSSSRSRLAAVLAAGAILVAVAGPAGAAD